MEGESVNLSVATEVSGVSGLQYSAEGLPPGLSIDSTTGLITGTISSGQSLTDQLAGHYPVKITLDDGVSSDSRTFVWSIYNADGSNELRPILLETDGRTDVLVSLDDLGLIWSADYDIVFVRLNRQPDTDVIVRVFLGNIGENGEALVAENSSFYLSAQLLGNGHALDLLFTPENWNVPVPIAVEATIGSPLVSPATITAWAHIAGGQLQPAGLFVARVFGQQIAQRDLTEAEQQQIAIKTQAHKPNSPAGQVNVLMPRSEWQQKQLMASLLNDHIGDVGPNHAGRTYFFDLDRPSLADGNPGDAIGGFLRNIKPITSNNLDDVENKMKQAIADIWGIRKNDIHVRAYLRISLRIDKVDRGVCDVSFSLFIVGRVSFKTKAGQSLTGIVHYNWGDLGPFKHKITGVGVR
ncbi:MAG: Ig domain-containing protein [Candidatus Caldarchaeum sp.]